LGKSAVEALFCLWTGMMADKTKSVSREKEKGVQFSQTSEVTFSAEKPPIPDRFVAADARWRGECPGTVRSPFERHFHPWYTKGVQYRFVVADARWRGECPGTVRSPIERHCHPWYTKGVQFNPVLVRFLFVLSRPAADRSITLGKGERGHCGGFLQVSWEFVRWGPRKCVQKFVRKAGVLIILPRCYGNGALLLLRPKVLQNAQNDAELAQSDEENAGKHQEREEKNKRD
jgi:hypothetical protein